MYHVSESSTLAHRRWILCMDSFMDNLLTALINIAYFTMKTVNSQKLKTSHESLIDRNSKSQGFKIWPKKYFSSSNRPTATLRLRIILSMPHSPLRTQERYNPKRLQLLEWIFPAGRFRET